MRKQINVFYTQLTRIQTSGLVCCICTIRSAKGSYDKQSDVENGPAATITDNLVFFVSLLARLSGKGRVTLCKANYLRIIRAAKLIAQVVPQPYWKAEIFKNSLLQISYGQVKKMHQVKKD